MLRVPRAKTHITRLLNIHSTEDFKLRAPIKPLGKADSRKGELLPETTDKLLPAEVDHFRPRPQSKGPGTDTLVVLDDSIVRGNTMKNAILPMLDRLGPKRIVVASSAPPIRYPDCYGIDMSTLGELVAFRALVNLLGGRDALVAALGGNRGATALPTLYARFADEQHCAEIARLLTPPGMKAEVKVVYQSIDALHAACPGSSGDWYFTGDYPTPGGYKVLHKALENYLGSKDERSY